MPDSKNWTSNVLGVVCVSSLALVFLTGDGSAHILTPTPDGNDGALLERLSEAEERAQFYKFEGFLHEEPATQTGEIQPGPREGNEGDKRAAEEVRRVVNEARQRFFASFTKDPKELKSQLQQYVADRKETDKKELQKYAGETLFRISAPTWSLERLLPALTQEFLRVQYSAKTITIKRLDNDIYINASLEKDRRVSVQLSVRREEDARKALAANACDLALWTENGSTESKAMLLGWGGVGIVVNPQREVDALSAPEITRLLHTRATWPVSQGGGPVNWVAVRNDPDLPAFAAAVGGARGQPSVWVDSYEQLEQSVFQDRLAIALVPLGLCATTDNRLLRLTSSTDGYGLRPTPLTAANNYPWRLALRLGVAGDGAGGNTTAIKSFLTFVSTAAGVNVLVNEGYGVPAR